MVTPMNSRIPELRRDFANSKYERTEEGGVYFSRGNFLISGMLSVSLNGGPWEDTPNLIVNEGLVYLLNVGLSAGAQLSTFYVAPFYNNVTPIAGLTAASFNADQGEFDNYSEPARPTWVDAGVVSQYIENTATPALITVAAGVDSPSDVQVWGAALISASGKLSGLGTMIGCAKFTAARTGLQLNDELRLKYRVTASSS